MIAALVLGVVLAVIVWRLADRAQAAMVLGIAAVLAAWIYGEVSRPAVHAAAAPPRPVPTRTVVVHAAPAVYHGPNGLEITIIVIVAIVFVVGASIGGAWYRGRQ